MSFIIIGVYRPPSANDTFYDQLTDTLKDENALKKLIIKGDFNLNRESKRKINKNKLSCKQPHRSHKQWWNQKWFNVFNSIRGQVQPHNFKFLA